MKTNVDNKKIKLKYLIIVYLVAFVNSMLIFLFARYKLHGYLYKSDWVLAFMILLIGSIVVFVRFRLDKRKK